MNVMKPAPILVVTAVWLLARGFSAAPQEAAKPGPGEKGAQAAPPELRRPGFLFLELGTRHLDDYIAFFQSVAGFRLTRREGRYAELNSEVGELLLIDPELLPAGHPFHGKLTGNGQGLGVEIGLVVADLDKAYAAATIHQGWKISTGIVRRPWGVRDFRVLSPDGYYLRFTEPPR
jgi:catechol 2,3-dioxygenase-like lactoylglutathione lyase family enzyme